MNTIDAAIGLDRPTGSIPPVLNLRRRWWVVTVLLAAICFMETVFAGAMLSGVEWARRAHAATAVILIASTLMAGLVAAVTLRRVPRGLRFGLALLSVGAVAFIQAAIGALSAKGANLTWLHVPLGVALVGLAMQTAARARRLGEAS